VRNGLGRIRLRSRRIVRIRRGRCSTGGLGDGEGWSCGLRGSDGQNRGNLARSGLIGRSTGAAKGSERDFSGHQGTREDRGHHRPGITNTIRQSRHRQTCPSSWDQALCGLPGMPVYDTRAPPPVKVCGSLHRRKGFLADKRCLGNLRRDLKQGPRRIDRRTLIREIAHRLTSSMPSVKSSLDRRPPTLSGGESQRHRLATQIGSTTSRGSIVLITASGIHTKNNARLLD